VSEQSFLSAKLGARGAWAGDGRIFSGDFATGWSSSLAKLHLINSIEELHTHWRRREVGIPTLLALPRGFSSIASLEFQIGGRARRKEGGENISSVFQNSFRTRSGHFLGNKISSPSPTSLRNTRSRPAQSLSFVVLAKLSLRRLRSSDSHRRRQPVESVLSASSAYPSFDER